MMINNFIQNLKPYIPIPHKIWEIENRQEILKLDWNESTIAPSPKVISALQDFLVNGNLNWYPNTHNNELYDELSQYCKLDSTNIEIFASSDCLHEYILSVFLNVGDKVCIVSPTYDNFRSRAQGIGIQTLFFDLDSNFDLNFKCFFDYLKTNVPQMVYICNPNNPTGKFYNKENLQRLIEYFGNILFVIDEAYFEFCNKNLSDCIKKYKNLIITRTFSKAFGLASFRIGYCLSQSQNIDLLNKLRNPKSISQFAQIAAISALQDMAYMKKYVKEVAESRIYFIESMRKMGLKIYDSEANFALAECKQNLYAMLETKGIFIRNYSHIIPNHYRITIGTMSQMKRVIKTIAKVL